MSDGALPALRRGGLAFGIAGGMVDDTTGTE
jgi:hypothetical protein